MPGDPVRLGPFIGGINTLSDAAALDDTELLDCVNFELDLDGSLLNRPPITVADGPGSTTMTFLCYAYFSGTSYIIASAAGGIYYYSGSSWTLITATITSVAAVQWRNYVWIAAAPGEADPGGYWSPGGGFVTVANLPKCTALITHKERLYASGTTANPSMVAYSDPQDGTVWGANSNFQVNNGDGETVVDMIVHNDNIVIFKQNSTYVFPFDTGPTSGVLRRISGTIGVGAKNCVALYEQALYVLHEKNVYEVINYDFARLNTKVAFIYDPTVSTTWDKPYFVCIVGNRLIVRYYKNVYVFGMRTRTWTRWESTLEFGPFLSEPDPPTGVGLEIFYAPSAATANNDLYRIKDGFEAGVAESMTCSIQTKIYDLAISARFKRLFWWGVDVNTVNAVTGKMIPINSVFAVTWSQLGTYQWSALSQWVNPTITQPTIDTTVTPGVGGVRLFLKFLKGIRFRQVQFIVEMTTTGVPTDAPARLFNITTFVATKETVVKAVS